jgi:pimeloyl-ACP methyl ester carboxylesterase
MADGTRMVSVGRHVLAATVFGAGEPAVVIEPSFGGAAEDWAKIASVIARQATVVTYDRAPYGDSSAARDHRTPDEIADDLDGLLDGLGVTGPLVLVGHSAGGLYVRAYAAAHLDRVAGMVLVESSHEGQRPVLDPLRSRRSRLGTALTVPSIMRESRTERRGGDRRSIIREWRTFNRVTAGQPRLGPGALGQLPLVVLTCAAGDPDVPLPVWQRWHGLHQELAGLSANSRHVVSASSQHYLNVGDQELVTGAITDVVRSARTGLPLSELAGGPEPPAPSEPALAPESPEPPVTPGPAVTSDPAVADAE